MSLFARSPLSVHDGAGFARDVERLLWHTGFVAVTNVDGSGDQGADIVADREGYRWVFQCKFKSSGGVGEEAVEEALRGLHAYGAARAAVVTNATFTRGAKDARDRCANLAGADVRLIDGKFLSELWSDPNCAARFSQPELRPYQASAFAAVRHDLTSRGRALLVLATGLGKTVVAGSCVEWVYSERKGARVLVVAHAKELVEQLERAMWRHLSKECPTQLLTGESRPAILDGLTCATIQSALIYVREGYRPDFIVVDEAHHVGADSQFSELIRLCSGARVLGVTATPWRGDAFNVEDVFGSASFKVGIEEGMRLGFLCDVDYRVFADNIDWNFVSQQGRCGYSIAELNSRLFLPQRDEQIRDRLLDVWHRTPRPRGIIFCQSIEHAERMHSLLQKVGMWSCAGLIHGGLPKRARQVALLDFRAGKAPLLVAVDVLNEGVDVPDVNVVCFARVTHSRRIFIQQLGRGLRVSASKDRVVVLDFISDLRRVACLLKLRKRITAESDVVHLPSSHRIEFTDLNVENLMMEWMKDAADLDTASDQVRLDFPDLSGGAD
jgi:superfamily II DNA or RNA helicase